MHKTLLVLGLALLLTATVRSDDFRVPLDTINQTLNYIGIDTSDVGFRTDWVDLDTFRLSVVNAYTRRPLGLPAFTKGSADSLLALPRTVDQNYRMLQRFLDQTAAPAEDSLHWDDVASRNFRDFEHQASSCDSLVRLTRWALLRLDKTPGSAGGDFAKNEMLLKDSFELFLREEEKDVELPLDALDSLQKQQERAALRLRSICDEGDIRYMASNGAGAVGAYQLISDWLELQPNGGRELAQCRSLAQLRDLKTPFGRIAIGGPGNDRYEGVYSIIIDFGGDDEYYLSRSPEYKSQIIIDLAGDDKYFAQTDHAIGAGFFSAGILDDWSGNDLYVGKKYSLGCGMFGVGILRDRAGDDTYQGDLLTQGAATFGVGMLIDEAGRDTYSAALYAQGFGFIMGAGALIDFKGNDRYTAGWKYGDILRYEDHYVSLSQGFGYGLRPYFSGGIGLLVDGDGNDQYSADIFGQGASYWYAIGGLIDYGGNDNYIAYQYAQGAATHMCLANLIDISGDDLYSSKGVSQGCGHDIAFAMLLDCAGNDQYSATDLSQAAGSANGIGMLLDLSGNDGHIARVANNTHGYGNPRREYGSIGLFLDLSGIDDYRGNGRDASYWITNSKWGIGADLQAGGGK